MADLSPNQAEYAAPTDETMQSGPDPDESIVAAPRNAYGQRAEATATQARQALDDMAPRASLPASWRADYRDPAAPAIPAGKRVLGRADILSAGSAPKIEYVDVPEWGAGVLVKGLDSYMLDKWEIHNRRLRDAGDVENVRARLLAWTIVDESGLRVFSDADIDEIGHMDPRGVNRVFTVATRLSAMSEDTREQIATKSPE